MRWISNQMLVQNIDKRNTITNWSSKSRHKRIQLAQQVIKEDFAVYPNGHVVNNRIQILQEIITN